MRLLDLFCGAGGAAVGYHRAGFDEIVGVDNRDQPRYPFTFVKADAMTYPLDGFDAIHASPPCQAFTSLKSMYNVPKHANLLTPTLARLDAVSKPWVVENVAGSPMRSAIMLCGSMFSLGTGDAELRRHRLFELSFPMLTPSCAHGQRPRTAAVSVHSGGSSNRERAKSRVIGVYGGHGRDRRRRDNTQGFSTAQRAEAMGIDWMTGNELSQAIPPAYTEYIGKRLLESMEAR